MVTMNKDTFKHKLPNGELFYCTITAKENPGQYANEKHDFRIMSFKPQYLQENIDYLIASGLRQVKNNLKTHAPLFSNVPQFLGEHNEH